MRHCILLAATAMLLTFAAPAEGGRLFCQHCGCCQNCKKVCRLKCEKKKETKTEYTCECEDFCIPGPSKKCGVKKEHDCQGHHRTILWQPTCARVRTRKKLVKKEVTKEVPDYKWVVEEYCCVCGHWVKVDREKDKDKTKSNDESGAEKPAKSEGGSPKDKQPKPAQSDRPPNDDSRKDEAEQEDGDSNAEPLPAPPAQRGDRQTRLSTPAQSDRAYRLDAAAAAGASVDVMTVADAEASQREPEPRSHLFGIFRR